MSQTYLIYPKVLKGQPKHRIIPELSLAKYFNDHIKQEFDGIIPKKVTYEVLEEWNF